MECVPEIAWHVGVSGQRVREARDSNCLKVGDRCSWRWGLSMGTLYIGEVGAINCCKLLIIMIIEEDISITLLILAIESIK
jgi:hypothetical protein